MGTGIASSENRVLAPLQVAKEIWLQPGWAGVKARPGVTQGLRSVRELIYPQPSGAGLRAPCPHLSEAGQHPSANFLGAPMTRKLEKLSMWRFKSSRETASRGLFFDKVHNPANTKYNFDPKLLHPRKLLSTWTSLHLLRFATVMASPGLVCPALDWEGLLPWESWAPHNPPLSMAAVPFSHFTPLFNSEPWKGIRVSSPAQRDSQWF